MRAHVLAGFPTYLHACSIDQVVRILLIFAILLFLNASAERLRHAQGHQWAQLRTELPRLLALRKLRWRLLLVYLVLPILFMFLEVQVLDWRAAWFKVLWREALDLHLVALVAHQLRPSATTYTVHFSWLRPAPNAQLSSSLYLRFFRFLHRRAPRKVVGRFMRPSCTRMFRVTSLRTAPFSMQAWQRGRHSACGRGCCHRAAVGQHLVLRAIACQL